VIIVLVWSLWWPLCEWGGVRRRGNDEFPLMCRQGTMEATGEEWLSNGCNVDDCTMLSTRTVRCPTRYFGIVYQITSLVLCWSVSLRLVMADYMAPVFALRIPPGATFVWRAKIIAAHLVGPRGMAECFK